MRIATANGPKHSPAKLQFCNRPSDAWHHLRLNGFGAGNRSGNTNCTFGKKLHRIGKGNVQSKFRRIAKILIMLRLNLGE